MGDPNDDSIRKDGTHHTIGDEDLVGKTAAPTIHGYTIRRKLGEGAMGIVFEAQQIRPHRPVAIKIIRGAAVDPSLIRMFSREAEALARLSHPGVAAIHEFGQTVDGLPYFAMELIRGEPLHQYLGGRPSPLQSRAELEFRLKLFQRICDAVSYAHMRAVIHRDLKPGNILVQRGVAPPRVKVLDFGMARITDADVATVATEVGKIQGTLAYMSPEQARGNPDEIDLRSDVYSLGVILYEMLKGNLPYRTHQVPIHEAVRAICEDTPQSLTHHGVGRDLGAIVATATHKDPNQRYGSVAALAQDLERYLTDQPILARPPTTAYQLRMLLRRHRFAATFLATVATLLVVLTVVMLLMTNRISRERDLAQQAQHRAEQERHRAESLKDFTLSLFDATDPDAAASDINWADRDRQRLDQLVAYLADLYRTPNTDAAVTAERKQQLEGFLDTLFPPGSGVTVREMLLRAAEDIPESELPPLDQMIQLTAVGEAFRRLGLYADAASVLEAAMRIQSGLPDAPLREVATTLTEAAFVFGIKMKEPDTARELIDACLKSYGQIAQPTLDDTEAYASCLALLGSIESAVDRHEDADSRYAQAISIFEADPAKHVATLATLKGNRGLNLERWGRSEQAEIQLKEALQLREEVHGPNHSEVAATCNNLGELYRRQGRCGEAEPYYRRALEIREARFGDRDDRTSQVMNNWAICFMKNKQFGVAATMFEQVIQSFEQIFGSEHQNVGVALMNLGEAELNLNAWDQAERTLRRSLAIEEKHYGATGPWFGATLALLAAAADRQGRHEDAKVNFERARRIMEASFEAEAYAKFVEYYAPFLRRTGHEAQARALEERLASH